MKKLIFYESNNIYAFKIIDNDSLCDYNNILHIWKTFPDNIIERLKNVPNSLFYTFTDAGWDGETLHQIKICFFDEPNEPSLHIFISQIIDMVDNIINEHEIE